MLRRPVDSNPASEVDRGACTGADAFVVLCAEEAVFYYADLYTFRSLQELNPAIRTFSM